MNPTLADLAGARPYMRQIQKENENSVFTTVGGQVLTNRQVSEAIKDCLVNGTLQFGHMSNHAACDLVLDYINVVGPPYTAQQRTAMKVKLTSTHTAMTTALNIYARNQQVLGAGVQNAMAGVQNVVQAAVGNALNAGILAAQNAGAAALRVDDVIDWVNNTATVDDRRRIFAENYGQCK